MAIGGLLQIASIRGDAKQVAVEIEFAFGSSPAQLGHPLPLADGRDITLQRLDFLLSDFALQHGDEGKWIQADDLAAYLSLGEGRASASLGFVPVGKFTAIRFRLGVNPETNAADPNQFPAQHALNPLVNDLHWGWAGGYIFMALEGSAAPEQAFSYHLANDGNSQLITIPVAFETSRDSTIRLRFDIAKLFDRINVSTDGSSSHSREGDPIPAKLKAGLLDAITLSSISNERFQIMDPAVKPGSDKQRHRITPYPLQLSGRFPKVSLPVDNRPTIEGVALGRALFFDKRLSKNDSQSCSSCHDRSNAFSDSGKQFSIGVDGIPGKRNAQPLFNLAWQDGFFWDGRARTLREQVLMPISDPHEMNAALGDVVAKLAGDKQMREQFDHAFGDPLPNQENLARSLEQFLLTLISQDSKFDRAIRGELEFSADEKRGLELFVTEFDPDRGLRGADCFHCHGGNLFTSRRYTNNGLDAEFTDLGRFVVTRDTNDIGKFKTPSLRNVAVTAPYMHDGRFGSLEQVIDHYDHRVRRSKTLDPNLAKHPDTGLELSDDDKQALIAFLKTLTDQKFLEPEPS